MMGVVLALTEVGNGFYPQGFLAQCVGSEIEGKAFHVESLELAVALLQCVH